jgi:hypothetical protein
MDIKVIKVEVEVTFYDSEYEGGRKQTFNFTADRYNKKDIIDLMGKLDFTPVFCLVGYDRKNIVWNGNHKYDRHAHTIIRYTTPDFKEVRKLTNTRDFRQNY